MLCRNDDIYCYVFDKLDNFGVIVLDFRFKEDCALSFPRERILIYHEGTKDAKKGETLPGRQMTSSCSSCLRGSFDFWSLSHR